MKHIRVTGVISVLDFVGGGTDCSIRASLICVVDAHAMHNISVAV